MSLPSRFLFALASVTALSAQACSFEDTADWPQPQPQLDAGLEDVALGFDAGPDADDAGSDADVEVTPPPKPYALFIGSDFSTVAHLAVVDLDEGAVAGTYASDDQDTIADSSGRHAFLLHRGQGSVSVLDEAQPWKVARTIAVPNPASGLANPYAVVVAAGDKAYVVRYSANSIAVVNITTGKRQGEIDLSAYVADDDGLVDAFDAVHDPATKRVYVGLQRVNQNEYGGPPDYVHACTDTKAAIVGIDTATDEVVDLNGEEDGEALLIEAVNPASLHWDEDNQRILVLGVGCAADQAAPEQRAGRGVEAVVPEDGTRSWIWQTDALDRPATLLPMAPDNVLIALDDANYARHWYPLDPSSGVLGDELNGVPQVPVAGGADWLVGLAPSAASDNLDAVRYDLATGDTQIIAKQVFPSNGLFPYASVVLR